MRLSELLKCAAENGVDPLWAVNQRLEFLASRYFDLRLAFDNDGEFDPADEVEERIYRDSVLAISAELRRIKLEQTSLKEWKTKSEEKPVITEEEVAEARAYPVDRLVRFVKGKALAWCHADKNPSLVFMTRNRVAWCPVCDKYFNAIDVLMTRDGMSFIDAVKELVGR